MTSVAAELDVDAPAELQPPPGLDADPEPLDRAPLEPRTVLLAPPSVPLELGLDLLDTRLDPPPSPRTALDAPRKRCAQAGSAGRSAIAETATTASTARTLLRALMTPRLRSRAREVEW